MVLIFILIYFGWRDTENQQYLVASFFLKSQAVRLRNGKPKIVWRLLSFAISRWDTDKKF